jgi:hypothetical protein
MCCASMVYREPCMMDAIGDIQPVDEDVLLLARQIRLNNK